MGMRWCHVMLVFAVAACGHEASRPVTSGSGSAPPVATSPIQLTAAASHGVLTLTLTNTTSAPVTIASHVIGGRLANYDWLSVELDGGAAGTRELHFMSARDESGTITADVAAGAAHTAEIDLVQWAVEAGNGGPLVPGTYAVRATWDTSAQTQGVTVVATATTTLVVEPPGPENCAKDGYQAPAGAVLMLLGHQADTGRATVDLGLYNVGPVAVCVDSYIHTHELQYDWFTVMYADGGKYHHASRVIHLDDAREKSYPVSVLLGPGQTIWHSIDVDAWAKRDRNGKEPLPAGSLYTQIGYDSTHETDVWAGTLLSQSFGVNVK